MSLQSITIDSESTNDEIESMSKSKILIKNFLLHGLCLIVLILMIVFVSIVRNYPPELRTFIWIGLIGMIILILIRSIILYIELKNYNLQTAPKNTLTYIMKYTNIYLILFTGLFVGFIVAPVDFGYGSLAAFISFFIYTVTLICVLGSIIYLLINFIRFLWKKLSFIRQQLSTEIISFFLSSCIVCFYFMCFFTIQPDSSSTGLGYGIALVLSNVLFIGGIIGTILYHSKRKRIFSGLTSSIGCVGIILILRFYLNDGYDMKINVIIPSERFPNNLTHDPSLNGNYSYSFLTYGDFADFQKNRD